MKRIVLFVLLTALFSAPCWWLTRIAFGGYSSVLMWCPGLAAVVTLKLTGGKLSELGWRGANLGWGVLAWIVTIAGISIAYAVVVALGFVGFPDSKHLAHIAGAMGFGGLPQSLAVLALGAFAATAGLANGLGRALGEELGWRGLFTPEACKRFGFLPGALLVGVVWALWHFPLMVGETTVVGLVNFTVMVVGISVAYAWFRLKSQSVWPTTLMHALHNALRNVLFADLTFSTMRTSDAWLDETGYAFAAMGVVAALVFAGVEAWTSTKAPSASLLA